MPKVTFVNEKKTVEVPQGANLRREALKAGVYCNPAVHTYINCGGLGLCGTCRVVITKGIEHCSRQGAFEKLKFATDPMLFFARIGVENPLRLACRVRVNGDVEVETLPMFRPSENYWS
jgi:ferredoxin